jgi:hypothetical protein
MEEPIWMEVSDAISLPSGSRAIPPLKTRMNNARIVFTS